MGHPEPDRSVDSSKPTIAVRHADQLDFRDVPMQRNTIALEPRAGAQAPDCKRSAVFMLSYTHTLGQSFTRFPERIGVHLRGRKVKKLIRVCMNTQKA